MIRADYLKIHITWCLGEHYKLKYTPIPKKKQTNKQTKKKFEFLSDIKCYQIRVHARDYVKVRILIMSFI